MWSSAFCNRGRGWTASTSPAASSHTLRSVWKRRRGLSPSAGSHAAISASHSSSGRCSPNPSPRSVLEGLGGRTSMSFSTAALTRARDRGPQPGTGGGGISALRVLRCRPAGTGLPPCRSRVAALLVLVCGLLVLVCGAAGTCLRPCGYRSAALWVSGCGAAAGAVEAGWRSLVDCVGAGQMPPAVGAAAALDAQHAGVLEELDSVVEAVDAHARTGSDLAARRLARSARQARPAARRTAQAARRSPRGRAADARRRRGSATCSTIATVTAVQAPSLDRQVHDHDGRAALGVIDPFAAATPASASASSICLTVVLLARPRSASVW